MGGLRVLRVLRPLRSLKGSPRLSAPSSMMEARLRRCCCCSRHLPRLWHPRALGGEENRCRATPWPVTWDYAAFEEANGPQAALDAVLAGDFRCRDADNFAALPGAGWFAVTSPKEKSAWREPAACYWPLAGGPLYGDMRAWHADEPMYGNDDEPGARTTSAFRR